MPSKSRELGAASKAGRARKVGSIAGRVSDFGSEMGAGSLRQVRSGAVASGDRKPLTCADTTSRQFVLLHALFGTMRPPVQIRLPRPEFSRSATIALPLREPGDSLVSDFGSEMEADLSRRLPLNSIERVQYRRDRAGQSVPSRPAASCGR